MAEYFDTTPQPEKAAVFHIEQPNRQDAQSVSFELRKTEERLDEAIRLTEALKLDVVHSSIIELKKFNPKLLLGTGKAEEAAEIMEVQEATVAIINATLTPTQHRNLEIALNAKVVDRTHLILEIFADRAQTKAGRFQVELAQQLYLQGRLVRAWTHLERQRGGTSNIGGPGERQIELDRRMISDRIKFIKNKLKDVERERVLQRKSRERQELPVVSLVGYTNAGKSTLFNALVSDNKGEKVEAAFVKDMLFATLDPLMRKIKLPSGRECILSDTVGFVSDLPHELVDAFASTLEEVTLSDLILHVHDASSVEVEAQSADVNAVLRSIKASEIATIHVANKTDKIESVPTFLMEEEATEISAIHGNGIPTLLEEIDFFLGRDEQTLTLEVPASDGQKLAFLHAKGHILSQDLEGETWHISVRLKQKDVGKFNSFG